MRRLWPRLRVKHKGVNDRISTSGSPQDPSPSRAVETISATPLSDVRGEVRAWAEQAGVESSPVTCVWWTKPMKAGATLQDSDSGGGFIGLHFHGGGYRYGSALSEGGFARIPKGLIHRRICPRVLSVHYTLVNQSISSSPSSFPLQLLEGLAGYYHLTRTLHIPPKHVLLIGDSAGAHLVLALARYILENENLQTESAIGSADRKLLGGVILLSPWCDLTECSSDHPGVQGLLGPLASSLLSGPYFSPSLHPIPSGWPPTFIASSSGETFAPQIEALVHRLLEAPGNESSMEDCGNNLVWHKMEGLPGRYAHDMLIYDMAEVGWPDKVEACWTAIVEWKTGNRSTK